MKLFDTVRLKNARPKIGLGQGEVGVIVAVLDSPRHAFEVEFVNFGGETVAVLTLGPEELEELDVAASA
jgi:hypothetical protein